MTYEELDAQLIGRNLNRCKLANNTYAHRVGDAIAIRLHDTDVPTFFPDGRIVVTSGGWRTSTTKGRINAYLPSGFYIWQRSGLWYWAHSGGSLLFADGDVIKNGKLKPQAKDNDEKSAKQLRARINKYARLCSDQVPLPKPGHSDCFYCQMVVSDGDKKGQSLGDASKDVSHLELHIDEGYVVPSLVFNALKERGCTDVVISSAFTESNYLTRFAKDQVKRAVAKYLQHRFNQASR